MNHITPNDIEYYLLNYEYNELSEEQLEIVSQEIKSKEEFNELRGFMLMHNETSDEGIIPPPQIKSALMKEFAKAHHNGFWASAGVFLFPKEKPIHSKPGIQLLAIAASIILIFTVFINYEQKKSDLAINKTDNKDHVSPTIEVEKEDGIKEEYSLNEVEKELETEFVSDEETIIGESNGNIENISTLEQEIDGLVENLATNNKPEDASGYMNDELENDGVFDQESMELESTTSAETISRNEDLAVAEENLQDEQIISGYTQPTSEQDTYNKRAENGKVVLDKTVTAKKVSAPASYANQKKEKTNTDLPVNSRTLKEDEELIDILYTSL